MGNPSAYYVATNFGEGKVAVTYNAETTATGTHHNGDPVNVTFTCKHRHPTERGAGRCATKLQATIAVANLNLTYTRYAIDNNGARHTL